MVDLHIPSCQSISFFIESTITWVKLNRSCSGIIIEDWIGAGQGIEFPFRKLYRCAKGPWNFMLFGMNIVGDKRVWWARVMSVCEGSWFEMLVLQLLSLVLRHKLEQICTYPRKCSQLISSPLCSFVWKDLTSLKYLLVGDCGLDV